jgi:hypothetical protein
VEAHDTIEIRVPVDCHAPAAECIGDIIEANGKVPYVVANTNATGILKTLPFRIVPVSSIRVFMSAGIVLINKS